MFFYLDLNMYGIEVNFKAYYIILNLLCNKRNEHFIYWVNFPFYHEQP